MELLESIAFGICLFAFGDIQTQYYQCECKHENVKRTFGTSAVLVKNTHGHRFGSDLRGNEHYLSSIKNKT